MSFSAQIKEKLCEYSMDCPMCPASETAGILRTAAYINDIIKFTTENDFVAHRIAADIKNVFGITVQITGAKKSKTITIENYFEAENIKSILTGDPAPFSCCKASYLRGAFLGGGSVSDPAKSYHLEICTKHKTEAEYISETMLCFDLKSKITNRKNNYVVYLKGCEQIAQALGLMGAPVGALEVFNIQIEKEMRNNINRRVNCENANAEKMAKAASKHIVAINKIKKSGKWDKLPEVLQEIGELRCIYPECSLKELGEMLDIPIGKSGVNHRLNRILEFADNL